jgi:hypothetical protein
LEKEGYNDTQKAIQEHAGIVVSKEGFLKDSHRVMFVIGLLLFILFIQGSFHSLNEHSPKSDSKCCRFVFKSCVIDQILLFIGT